jgi:hypothetical protein
MYIINGAAYAGEPEKGVKVVSVLPLRGRKLQLRFSTEEIKIFDFTPLLDSPGFRPLQDEAVFNNVSLDHGVPVWCGGEIDIAPEKLYQDGVTADNTADCRDRLNTVQERTNQQEHGVA